MTARLDRQQLVRDRIVRCFGVKAADSAQERAMRLLEEALELAQSVECEREEVDRLVAYVFGREPGRPFQEVGGVAITLLGFCASQCIKLEEAEFAELRRILAKPPEAFQVRHELKADAGIALRVPEVTP